MKQHKTQLGSMAVTCLPLNYHQCHMLSKKMGERGRGRDQMFHSVFACFFVFLFILLFLCLVLVTLLLLSCTSLYSLFLCLSFVFFCFFSLRLWSLRFCFVVLRYHYYFQRSITYGPILLLLSVPIIAHYLFSMTISWWKDVSSINKSLSLNRFIYDLLRWCYHHLSLNVTTP